MIHRLKESVADIVVQYGEQTYSDGLFRSKKKMKNDNREQQGDKPKQGDDGSEPTRPSGDGSEPKK